MANKLTHISFIMDGNNRWSKKKNFNLFSAYSAGANNLLKISNFLFKKYKVKYISCFALSKRNLNRPSKLISTLKKVLDNFLDKKIHDNDLKFKIQFIGDLSFLDTKIRNKINTIENYNKNSNMRLLIFINYSGQHDILNSVNDIKSKKLVNLDVFRSKLITKNIPDPDLLIRTGGYQRISDFMLFQLSFTELFFSKKLWPDIKNSDIDKIIHRYINLDRKFGL